MVVEFEDFQWPIVLFDDEDEGYIRLVKNRADAESFLEIEEVVEPTIHAWDVMGTPLHLSVRPEGKRTNWLVIRKGHEDNRIESSELFARIRRYGSRHDCNCEPGPVDSVLAYFERVSSCVEAKRWEKHPIMRWLLRLPKSKKSPEDCD